MNAVWWDICDEVRNQIRDRIDFESYDGLRPPSKENIRVWMIPFGSNSQGERRVGFPAILVSPGRIAEIPPSGGTNARDDVIYPVLIQIVMRTATEFDEGTIRTLLKWGEQIRKYFNQQNLRGEVWESQGYVNIAWVEGMDFIDERQFQLQGDCVQAIPLSVMSREPRDSDGLVRS